jgi:signal transduction histidine kinase/ActR/RegA family two-component response regulator
VTAIKHRLKDGAIIDVDITARPIAFGDTMCRLVLANDVTDRVALENQLRQAQKMEAVGQLASGVAHDFNNLLTVISAGVDFARESLPPASRAITELAMVEDAAQRATRLIRQLLAFSRKQVLKPELVDVNRVLNGVEPMLRRLIGEDIDILAIPSDTEAFVFADPTQLEQVIVNLAVNARDAMAGGGTLTIQTARVSVDVDNLALRTPNTPPGEYVRLTVRDTGDGMDEATLAHAFEPFFTTKGTGHGTGLGLATVYGIVEQSGGHIGVVSVPKEGTTFQIDLPLADAPEQRVAHQSPPATAAKATGTILLVEDEPPVRAIARRILSRQGYTVIEASNGREALGTAESHAGEIDLVVTDMVMPEMSGRAFADVFLTAYPGTPVLFVSGYTDDELLRRGPLAPRTAFLEKPFTPDGLVEAVTAMLIGRESALAV